MDGQKSIQALPHGVDDAVLNRGQLARALDVSEPTIDRWIGEGLPVLQDGRNGRAYQFQLSACWAWKIARDDGEARATEEAERAVRQMRLSLVGGAGGDSEQALSPKQRAEIYEAEHKYMLAAKLRGELMKRQDVHDMVEEVFALIRDGIVALPDRLQRECNLDGRAVERAVTACDDTLAEATRRVKDFLSAAPRADAQQGLELLAS